MTHSKVDGINKRNDEQSEARDYGNYLELWVFQTRLKMAKEMITM